MNQLFTVGIGVSSSYGDVQEEMPPKMAAKSLVTISAFVYANHAGNVMTRQLHTGIILYVQNALIVWYSKRQNTVEAATFLTWLRVTNCSDSLLQRLLRMIH
jgi:hypothetical protein